MTEPILSHRRPEEALRRRRRHRQCQLDVARGELRCIIGPNGAGKSTFFALLCGIHRARRRPRSSSRAKTSPACSPSRRVQRGYRTHVSDQSRLSASERSAESRDSARHDLRANGRSRLTSAIGSRSSGSGSIAHNEMLAAEYSPSPAPMAGDRHGSGGRPRPHPARRTHSRHVA